MLTITNSKINRFLVEIHQMIVSINTQIEIRSDTGQFVKPWGYPFSTQRKWDADGYVLVGTAPHNGLFPGFED